MLLTMILAAIIALVIVHFAKLTWNFIVNWLRSRENLKLSDRDNIAFTLQEKLRNGQYETVEVIFNQRTDRLLDYNEGKIRSNSVDPALAAAHRREELVVYN